MTTASPDRAGGEAAMQARDVMTAKVVSVAPDTPVSAVARLLLDHGISAVPVLDPDGTPLGIVSEGDLVGRDEAERLARRDWWLALITGAQPLDQTLQARLQDLKRTARDVMSAPVLTVTEQTDLGEVAHLLALHRIKRVPVLRDGRVVGIVSRADLLRAFAAATPRPAAVAGEHHRGFLDRLFGEHHRAPPPSPPDAAAAPRVPAPEPTGLAAADLRHLTDDYHRGESQHHQEERRAVAQQRQERARQLIDAHIADEGWRAMLQRAREAAQNGQTEFMLLRFPSELCVDRGRAVNDAQENWPSTLRGEPAELYLRWQRELKPRGLHLSARVLEFPDGKPGDIGMFLGWAG